MIGEFVVRCEPLQGVPVELIRDGRCRVGVRIGVAEVWVQREGSRWALLFTLADARFPVRTHGLQARKTDALEFGEAVLCCVVAGAGRESIGPWAVTLVKALRERGASVPDLNDVALVHQRAGAELRASAPEICSGEIYLSTPGPGPWADLERPDRPTPAGLDRVVPAAALRAAGFPCYDDRAPLATLEPREFYGPPGAPTWSQRNTCSGDVAREQGA